MKLYIILSFLLLKICSSTETSFLQEEVKVYSNLSKSFEDTLVSKSNTQYLSRMELRIKGSIKGKGKLSYSHVPFHRKLSIDVTDTFDELILSDWYDNRCLIIFEPENPSVTGELSISFKAY